MIKLPCRKSCILILALFLLNNTLSVIAQQKAGDTIGSIQGTPKHVIAKSAQRFHTVQHEAKPRYLVANHHISHRILHSFVLRVHHQDKPQPLTYARTVSKRPTIIDNDFQPTRSDQPALISRVTPLKGPIFFVDDFRDPSRSQQLWEVLSGGGTFKFGYGKISLKDNTADFTVWSGETPNFPHLRLKLNPFPATGDWCCSFIYSYNKSSNHLNSSGVSIFRADHTQFAYLFQDGIGQSFVLDNHVIWSSTQNWSRHEISIRKSGSAVVVSLDGTKIGQTLVGDPPATVELGGTFQNETNWSNFDLDCLQIDDGSLPELVSVNNQVNTSPPPPQPAIFLDDFKSPEQSKKNWLINENGGTVRFHQGAMCLKDDPPDYDGNLTMQGKQYDQSGFPQVKLLQNPFPANRNWKLQFNISFNKSGPPNPDGILIMRADSSQLLAVGQDSSGEYALLNNKSVWRTGGNTGTHTLVLENQDDRVTLTIDGNRGADDYIYEPPTTVQLGGNLKHDSRGWNNFDLQSISVGLE